MNSKEQKKLLRLSSVLKQTGLSRSSIYSYIALGQFPKPIKIGERAVAWLSTDIEKWMDQKINDSQQASY